ncbi:MAG TPA: CoB--CoM heterodisulfide reductase iron-sulfur subunit B family protein [Syntrophomonadaceae bacterium]|nr:CoB--CoM heterodisulfide reductase iron-sulfur subunit B family protein [Syntrophomonadaceae bacterium]
MNEVRVVTPEQRITKIPEQIFLFRSCTGSMEYPGTESAVKEVLTRLGVEVIMDPDQTCCSGYILTCSGYTPEAPLAITARNLALVEQKYGLDTYVFCNGCFGYNRELSHLLNHVPALKDQANQLIGQWGYNYQGKTGIYHVQELYYLLIDKIKAQVVKPLNGLQVAAHYGCHYLAQQYGILDEGDLPTFHEKIIEALGGTPVFYKERRMCCGYAVGRGFTHKESIVQPHLARKLDSAKEEGVQLITTVCPGCNVGLDREQPNLAARGFGPYNIPVIDLSQLIGLALGVPVEKLGFNANTVSMDGVLNILGLGKGD